MNIRRYVILPAAIVCCLISTSCEKKTSIRAICKAEPTFCNDLNQDAWCRKDKAAVIRARLAFAEQPKDKERYTLLTSFHDYKACIEVVTVIEPKHLKEQRTTRVEGLLTASKEIERLNKETINSDNPYLLLYHWTYNSNADAGNAFLAKEGTAELDKPIFLQVLAYHYTSYDIDYSIKLLKRAIALNKDSYPSSLFESLATMHLKSKQYEQAYIWSLIAQEMGSKDVNEQMIERYQHFDSKQMKELKKKAKQLLNQIEDHSYSFPRVIRNSN